MIVLIVLSTGVNAASTYLLSKRDRDLIQIAYMNGAARMLALDIKDFMALKNDQRLSKKMVSMAADRYLIQVERINSTEKKLATQKASSKYNTSRMH